MPEPVRAHGATRAPYEPVDPLVWRRRVKSHPTGRAVFRVAVGVLGAALIIAAPLTGWLPGPGGIPLFLAGLAVLATEFLWAKRFQRWMLRYVRIYLSWAPRRQRHFWIGVALCLALIQWTCLAIAGVPGFIPEWAARWLRHLPWVD